jgi:hypothetical protein
MSIFRVADGHGHTVLETDDWVEALSRAEQVNWPRGGALYVRGTHPTHDWGPPHEGQYPPGSRRCTNCGSWEDGGSYGSQAPCGYDWSQDSLCSALSRERAARAVPGE